jgi:hypothetical protein
MTGSPVRAADHAIAAPQARLKLSPFIFAGLAYLLLASLAYRDIVLNFSSAIPGFEGRNTDFALFYWNVWWFQHAVFSLGQDPYFTNYILFPHTVNLAYHTFVPFLNVIALPIYAVLSLSAAINSLIIGSIVFSGLAMFAFLRQRAISTGLAFVGAALFAFTSFSTARVSYVHLSILPIGWLPLGLLAWDWIAARRTVKASVVLGGVLYAAIMTDLQFGIWLALLLVPYALFKLARMDRPGRGRVIALSGLAAAILIGLMLIAPLPQLWAGRDVSYPTTSLKQAQVRSNELSDFIAAPPRFFDSERNTLGVILPLAVALGLVRGRRVPERILWLAIGLGCLILALGPTLEPPGIPLPYQIVHRIAGGMYRVPARFILPAVFALISFAAVSLHRDYQRLTRAGRWVSIASVLVFLALENHWNEPFPIFRMPDYRVYHRIAADPGDFLVLEVPVGTDSGVADPFGNGRELQYYAAVHHKRLINGSVSRGMVGLTGAYRQWPIIAALAGEAPPPDLTAAREEFQRLSREWDIRYVVVHRDMLPVGVAHWAIPFFNTQPGWCLVDEDGPVLAYGQNDRVTCPLDLLALPADGTLQVGDGGDERYLGWGWYPAENVGGPQARWSGGQPAAVLRVRLEQRDYRVVLRTTAYPAEERVRVLANGAPLAEVSIVEGWSEYGFDLPAKIIEPNGMVELTLEHRRAESAYERTGGRVDDRRPLAIALDAVVFQPSSISP